MKRYAIFALALVLGCSMLTGCRRQDTNGNMSTPPTEAARPTTEPTTHATMPVTTPESMPTVEPTTDGTEPKGRGMMTDPIIK